MRFTYHAPDMSYREKAEDHASREYVCLHWFSGLERRLGRYYITETSRRRYGVVYPFLQLKESQLILQLYDTRTVSPASHNP
jgi:hypothetical protein